MKKIIISTLVIFRWTGDEHSSPGNWKNKDDAPELTGKFKATIRKTNNENGAIYNLIDYVSLQ